MKNYRSIVSFLFLNMIEYGRGNRAVDVCRERWMDGPFSPSKAFTSGNQLFVVLFSLSFLRIWSSIWFDFARRARTRGAPHREKKKRANSSTREREKTKKKKKLTASLLLTKMITQMEDLKCKTKWRPKKKNIKTLISSKNEYRSNLFPCKNEKKKNEKKTLKKRRDAHFSLSLSASLYI